MVSTAVMGTQPVSPAGSVTGVKKEGGSKNGASDFSQVMSKSLSNMGGQQTTKETFKPENTSKIQSKQPEQPAADKVEKASQNEQPVKTENTSNPADAQTVKEEPKDVSESIDGALEELKEELKVKLDVTEEDIITVLERMGLTMADLLNGDKLTEFVVEITGNESVLDILGDEAGDALLSLQNFVAQLTEDIARVSDIPVQEVADVAKQFDMELADAQHQTQDQMAPQQAMPEVTIVDERSSENRGTAGQDASDRQRGDNHEAAGTIVLNHLSQAVENTSMVQGMTTSEFQSVSIVNQIVEAARVTLNDNVSSMELTLNPESLGKINLNVTVKEGVVTAQIVTENQIAKDAIEGQIVMLREQLNNQGIKVQAVEVTIASHSFEAGYQQNNNNEQAQEGNKGRRRHGQINLSELEGLDFEDLTQEEQIVADMMVSEGNLVNFKA